RITEAYQLSERPGNEPCGKFSGIHCGAEIKRTRRHSASLSAHAHIVLYCFDGIHADTPMAPDIRRREIITALGGVVAWPFAARAQQTKRPTIGLLGGASQSAQEDWTAAFLKRMRELGLVE